MKHLVYIYGQLKSGMYFNDKYMSTSRLIGPALCSLDYSLYIDSLPSLVKEPTKLSVKGELYEVDDATLDLIDGLEDHPRTFKREPVEVMLNGEKLMAWAYIRPKGYPGHRFAHKEEEFL